MNISAPLKTSFRHFFQVLVFSLVGTSTANAAGGHLEPLVYDIGICLFSASLLAILFARFKIPSIAAFLLAGILVGPVGFKLITDPRNIETIAELGFILLLFMIGVEIDIRKIAKSGKVIITSGILQYPLTVLFGVLVVKALIWLGFSNAFPGDYDALYFGIFIAGSSTLLVVKMFQENYELDTESGHLSLGLLVFQDIWAVIVLTLQPTFNSPELTTVLISFLGMFLLVAISYLLAKGFIAQTFKWLAKEPQMIFVASIGWCFSVVFIGSSLDLMAGAIFDLDVTLSVGSGMSALIAGMTIAALPYSRDIIAKVGIVRDFFIVLFFVGLGMSVPVLDNFIVPALAVVLAVFSLLSRQIVFFPLFYITGGDQRLAQVTSLRLAQLSEFGLVIAYLGSQLGHISSDMSGAIIFGFVMTALLTPVLYRNAHRFYGHMAPVLHRLGFKEPPVSSNELEANPEIVLLGFHRVASSLLHEISEHRPELLKKILVIDFNVQIHAAIRRLGVGVRYGDLASEQTLSHSGIEKAKVVVATISDDILRGTSNHKLVQTIRQINPDAIVISNAEQPLNAKDIYEAGADYVYMGRVNTARALEEIIERTLDGTLSDYRQEQEEKHGKSHERSEILH
ncbi:cation:proton antiporter [Sneathiella aquimaris]|uniref:cation:proton antiporter n=1 Tax=Sneathiella aquimaris TaxID=2599305 RepID=UPI0014699DE0|nr:cation:proton antiporter [Sneathiella aquimaris]